MKSIKLLSTIYILTSILWIILTIKTSHAESEAGFYLQIILFLVPFIGALIGFKNAKMWGGFKSSMGKAITLISGGLLTWSLGMLVWNYYIFFTDIEVPFPSLADVIFILSWPLWAIGVFNLSKATGVKFALKQIKGKIVLIIIPLIAVALSYYLLIEVARGGVIDLDDYSNYWQFFFDMFYPIATSIILAITLTFYSLSHNFLGGKYKVPILILVAGFLVNYLADVVFAYTTFQETYFNGHFVDFLFLTAMFLLSLSVSLIKPDTNTDE